MAANQGSTVIRRLVIVGLVLVVAGLAFGFMPRHHDGQNCGSAFAGAPSIDVDRTIAEIESVTGTGGGTTDAACGDARQSFAVVAWVLLCAGGVVLVGGWVASGAASRSKAT